SRFPRGPLPNLRGEDEAELSFLSGIIESLGYQLHPTAHQVTILLGRVPESTEDEPKFCASMYVTGKSGLPVLDSSVRFGRSRKEALSKLLVWVETEAGTMMLGDREVKRREEGGRERGGRNGG
ncbi:hypothetical protein EK21DRAFT_27747, partial [Setomelanomma holmii]